MWFVNMNEAGQDAGILRSVSESWILQPVPCVSWNIMLFHAEKWAEAIKENYVEGNVKWFL